MFALYQRFVEQVKEEEIQAYNRKHQQYLNRAGKTQAIEPKPRREREHANRRPRNQNNMRESQPARTAAVVDNRPERPFRTAQVNHPTNINEDIKPQHNPSFSTQEQPIKPMVPQPSYHPSPERTPAMSSNPNNEMPSQYPEEEADVVLVSCPQGCGRKFSPNVLEKHIKRCGKGDKKRKVFKARKVDAEAEMLQKNEPEKQQKKSEVPKWKKQSEELRNRLNLIKGTGPIVEEVDERILCEGCGRKFAEAAAQKHIPKCIERKKRK